MLAPVKAMAGVELAAVTGALVVAEEVAAAAGVVCAGEVETGGAVCVGEVETGGVVPPGVTAAVTEKHSADDALAALVLSCELEKPEPEAGV